MERGERFVPLEPQKESTVLGEIISKRISRLVVSGIERLFHKDRESKIIDALERNIRHSQNISVGAGELYQKLGSQSLTPPKLEYLPTESIQVQDDGIEVNQEFQNTINELKELRKKSPQDYVDKRNALLSDLTSTEELHAQDETELGPYKIQHRLTRMRQSDNNNMIDEVIENSVCMEMNIPKAYLSVYNPRSGIRVELNKLLPQKIKLAPDDLRNVETVLDDETNELKYMPRKRDIKSYPGLRETEGKFSERPGLETIYYGNLTEKGGMLSLLHEISHAWQSVFQGKAARRSAYRELYHSIAVQLSLVDMTNTKWSEGEISSDIYQEMIQYLNERLYNFGAKIIQSDIKDQEQEKTAIVIKSAISDKKFTIHCPELNNRIQSYAAEERDAWAHAIRVLRYLRRNGLDLEPELRSLENFQSIIGPCLESYQEALDDQVRLMTTKSAFTHQKPRHQ